MGQGEGLDVTFFKGGSDMLKNWKTTLTGILAGLAICGNALHTSGVNIGHFGAGDFTQLIGGLAVAALGVFAKDHNVSGQ